MKKLHLFFISTPGIGNLVPLVEFASHLTNHDRRFSATVLIITVLERPIVNAYIKSRDPTGSGSGSYHHRQGDIDFVYLPTEELPSHDDYTSVTGFLSLIIEKHKPHVRTAISDFLTAVDSENTEDDDSSVHIAGLFVDMFSTFMVDVANEFNIPCYVYFASPASFLGFMLHYPIIDPQLASESVDPVTGLVVVPKDKPTEFRIPSLANPLPVPMFPTTVLKRKQDGPLWYLYHANRYRETKGIVVNTFRELEPYAIDSLNVDGIPPVYPIGPVLDLAGPAQWHPDRTRQENIMRWLDDQAPSSVVFLCFGSSGSLCRAQLREIAVALECTGLPFLWSIREPARGKIDLPGEYSKLEEILPQGFLDRTPKIGLVCGWVPQVTILAHKAIGGFVSHCGWNSILESLWYGVPIVTWPVYAEQQLNAFQLVKELGLATEIRIDYRPEGGDIVLAKELVVALQRLMNDGDEVRSRAKDMSEKSRIALIKNGSSYKSLESLIVNIIANSYR